MTLWLWKILLQVPRYRYCKESECPFRQQLKVKTFSFLLYIMYGRLWTRGAYVLAECEKLPKFSLEFGEVTVNNQKIACIFKTRIASVWKHLAGWNFSSTFHSFSKNGNKKRVLETQKLFLRFWWFLWLFRYLCRFRRQRTDSRIKCEFSWFRRSNRVDCFF